MLRLIGFITVIAFCVACEKEIVLNKKSATVLLTQKEWKLVSYGLDENKNGIIDPSEESIKDCEKDNDYDFNNDGTGKVFENTLNCGNGINDHSFNWQFINNETGLDFVHGQVNILALTENDMVVYHETAFGNGTIRFIMTYKH